MSVRREEEAAVSSALHAASSSYDDLPEPVGDRLDRVLEQLPSADTLHHSEASGTASWTERLRVKRVRYALASAAAAVILTVGAVAIAIQVVAPVDSGDSASSLAEADGGGRVQDDGAADGGEGAAPEGSDFEAEEDEEAQSDDGVVAEETMSVETFATGADYSSDSDVRTQLRDLGGESASQSVPPELAKLAEGGDVWKACQEAIMERYDGLPIAVDFARFDSEPAVVALLLSDSGEIAVAVSPACGDGLIEELFLQA